MSAALDESAITDRVLARFSECPDERLREILLALVRHLHAFAAQVRLTEPELMRGIAFLTATGQKCDDRRQEFILLSDVLGLSMQTVARNHVFPAGATEATVLGPFHVEGAPALPQLADISAGAPGTPLYVDASVRDVRGRPVAGARVDVWQADEDGLYDVQRPGAALQARATLHTDAQGSLRFLTVLPVPYPVPTDGPVGAMLEAAGRHAWRPAHLHFRIEAAGYHTLVTHLFRRDDPYLASDVVFGVRESLIADFIAHPAGTTPFGTPSATPFHTLHYAFVLAPG